MKTMPGWLCGICVSICTQKFQTNLACLHSTIFLSCVHHSFWHIILYTRQSCVSQHNLLQQVCYTYWLGEQQSCCATCTVCIMGPELPGCVTSYSPSVERLLLSCQDESLNVWCYATPSQPLVCVCHICYFRRSFIACPMQWPFISCNLIIRWLPAIRHLISAIKLFADVRL